MKLNLGCGSQVFEGWVNVDYSLGARLLRIDLLRSLNRRLRIFDIDWDPRIRIHNLAKRFPWVENDVSMIYCSHTLEHFTREQGRNFLLECHRVLREKGIIRILVPDLRGLVQQYMMGKFPSDMFIENIGVLGAKCTSRFKARLAPFFEVPHKCMYDAPTLLHLLDEVGFDVRQREPFESDIPDIRKMEVLERAQGAVVIEGTKKVMESCSGHYIGS